jgi:hypothetical protein
MTIFLPLNEEGTRDYENLQETKPTKNLNIYFISGDDYDYLEERNYTDILNVECDTIIDLFEEELIPLEKLPKALEITQILIRNTSEKRYIKLLKQFEEIFSLAIKCKTYVIINCYGNPNRYNDFSKGQPLDMSRSIVDQIQEYAEKNKNK